MIDFVRGWLFPPACVACEQPGPALCRACAPRASDAVAFSLDGIPGFALGPYEGALRRAIVAMKRGERDPLETFASLLACAVPSLAGTLVPVPTSSRRIAARGFDQAAEVALRLARLRGVTYTGLLAKHGRAQEGRSRRERVAASDRLRIRPGAALPAGGVTLFDDVCTTGATLRDAIRVVACAGVAVHGLVVIARSDGTPRVRSRS